VEGHHSNQHLLSPGNTASGSLPCLGTLVVKYLRQVLTPTRIRNAHSALPLKNFMILLKSGSAA
jgi:hypothetical protein